MLEKGDDGYENEEVIRTRRTPQRGKRRICQTIGLALLGLFALIGFAAVSMRSYKVLRRFDTEDPFESMSSDCSCGYTMEDALALNCTFDVFAAAWVPPSCSDKILNEKFDAIGPGLNGTWPYFKYKNGTQPLDLNEVQVMINQTIYTSRRWHVAHCLFYWIKEWRARELGRKLEERYYSLYHVTHCVGYILENDVDWDEITGQFDVKLTSHLLPEMREHQNALLWDSNGRDLLMGYEFGA